MSTYVCKLIFDDGQFYSAINSTIDQFVFPVFKSADNLARFTQRYLEFAYAEKLNGTEIQEDIKNISVTHCITKETIHNGALFLARMKRGETLSTDEACELSKFYDFLKFTVADHQHEYDETRQDVVDKMIDDIGMRQQYPKDWDWQDILDNAMYNSFRKKWLEVTYPKSSFELEKYSTPKQVSILAGRYISKLAAIANIVGPSKNSPTEIIEKFRPKNEVYKINEFLLKLKKQKTYRRSQILLGIYKQVVVSNKGRQANGEFKNFVYADPINGIELIVLLIKTLSEYGLKNCALRLQGQYL
jgi:hypothetical protein